MTTFTLPVDITDSFDTGIAFFNPGATAVKVTIRIMDSTGLIVGPDATISLAAKNHTAKFVSEIFPWLSNFRGSLAISAPSGVSAVTLRQNATPLSYTTLPAVSGTSHGMAAPAPLLAKTATGIVATTNVTVDQTLDGGFRIMGKINGPGWPAGIQAQNNTGDVFNGRTDQDTGKYLIVVPAGTYALKVGFGHADDWGEIATFITDPNPVQVSGDTTRDVTLPAKADLHEVTLTIGGQSPWYVFSHHNEIFTSLDNTVWGYFDQTTPHLPDGKYLVSIQILSGVLFNIGTVNVSGMDVTADLPLQPTAKLSGRITIGNSPVPAGAQVVIVDGTVPTDNPWPATSTVYTYNSEQYTSYLLTGRNYSVTASIPPDGLVDFHPGINFGINPLITYPRIPNTITLSGDTVIDFNLPVLPGYVTISGRVTDASGNGVKDVAVDVFGEMLTGAPNTAFSSSTITDAKGNYSVSVISGNNYQLKFTPPVAKPSPY